MQSLCPLGATYCDACERLFKQLWICLPGIARRTSPVMICSATDGFVEGAQSHFTFQALHRQRACGLPSFKQVPCVMAEVILAKMMYLLFLRPSGSVATSAVSLAGGGNRSGANMLSSRALAFLRRALSTTSVTATTWP